MIFFLETMRGKYTLILVSDYVREWGKDLLENNSDLAIFPYKFFSCELGMLKSDIGCFKYILNHLNIKANETIFIDDFIGNIEVAKTYGIDGIVFTGASDLELELMKRNLL